MTQDRTKFSNPVAIFAIKSYHKDPSPHTLDSSEGLRNFFAWACHFLNLKNMFSLSGHDFIVHMAILVSLAHNSRHGIRGCTLLIYLDAFVYQL